MIVPLLFIMAGIAFAAPSALGDDLEHELSRNPESMSIYVRQYFSEDPILADIAWCESRMRHLGKDGSIFRGKVDPDDLGVMQINTRFHGKKAGEMGIELTTLNGNLAYAQYLYDTQGAKPWLASSPCWSKIAHR